MLSEVYKIKKKMFLNRYPEIKFVETLTGKSKKP